MTEESERNEPSEGQPESAEGADAAEKSEQVPEEVSGEGATPLASSDEHSDAPGPHGLGPLTDEPEGEQESPGVAPLEEEPEEAS